MYDSEIREQLMEIIRGVNQIAKKQDKQLELIKALEEQLHKTNLRIDDLCSDKIL